MSIETIVGCLNPRTASRRLRSNVTAFLDKQWIGPAALVFILLGSTIQPLLVPNGGGWRESSTFALATVGCTVTILIRDTARNYQAITADDLHRLDVLAAQVMATYFLGMTVDFIWGSEIEGVPVVVALVAVATIRDAVEAVIIRSRAANAVRNQDDLVLQVRPADPGFSLEQLTSHTWRITRSPTRTTD